MRSSIQAHLSFKHSSWLNSERFTPWQLIVGTLTSLYAIRNLDKILGLAGISSKCHATIHMFLSQIHMPSSARASCQSGEFLER